MASQSAKEDKTMSSRLLTMKFMQRAAATGPKSAPSTPESRPSKRPRLSEPGVRASSSNADLKKVQEALAAEELKRQQALDRQAADAGDSRWELGPSSQPVVRGLNVVRAGYTVIDSPSAAGSGVANGANAGSFTDQEEGDEGTSLQTRGRRSFGRFNKTLEGPEDYQESSSSSSDSDEDESGSDQSSDIRRENHEGADDSKRKAASKRKHSARADEIREKRKARRRAEKQDQAQQAERRRNKQVKLNGLTSLSGRAERPKGRAKCFTCGSTEHKKDQCPKRGLGL